jgi:hypothetical protein
MVSEAFTHKGPTLASCMLLLRLETQTKRKFVLGTSPEEFYIVLSQIIREEMQT